MNRIWSLFKKELRAYFNSPIAFVVITVLLIGVGYFFFQSFFVMGQANLRTFFTIASWSFLLFGPAVTMKLFAEEKKSGTIEPLLALPVKEWEIVAGKFLSAWTVLGVYLLITLAYPISIAFIGDLDGGPIVGGYIGLFLLGAIFVALGLFASTITKNQVISLIVAVIVGLLLLVFDFILPFIPASLQNLFQFIGTTSHFNNISRGVIDSRDLIYAATLVLFLLFTAVYVLQGRLTDRSKVWRTNRFLYMASAAGLLVALNVLSFNIYGRLDLTEDKMFTLSKSSRELVATLDDQLVVKAYFSNNLPAPLNNHARFLRDTLAEYQNYSKGNFNFQFIDPGAPTKNGEPDSALIAEVTAANVPRIEVQRLHKDEVSMVKVYLGVALYYQDKIETIPVLQEINNLEYEISSRIAKMTRDSAPRVAFLTGHDELSAQNGLTAATQALGDKYELTAADLQQSPDSLTGLDMLIIAGPRKELPASQLRAIDQFIMNGGRVAFLLDRHAIDMQSFIGRPITTGLEALVEHYGVTIEPSMVLDEINQRVGVMRAQGNIRYQSYVAFPPFLRVGNFAADSQLVKNLRDLTLTFISPLTLKDVNNVEGQVIASSSEKTWLFENEDAFLVEPQMLPVPEESDFVGPQPLVATLEGSFESFYASSDPNDPTSALEQVSPDTRIVVVGSSTWLDDRMRNRLGAVFFANLLDWLMQDERMVGVRARAITNRPLEKIGPTTRNSIKYGNMIVLPLLFVALGLIRWRLRTNAKRKGL
jgi:gliding-associated putative ABC transporter substrate-binding component GldG